MCEVYRTECFHSLAVCASASPAQAVCRSEMCCEERRGEERWAVELAVQGRATDWLTVSQSVSHGETVAG